MEAPPLRGSAPFSAALARNIMSTYLVSILMIFSPLILGASYFFSWLWKKGLHGQIFVSFFLGVLIFYIFNNSPDRAATYNDSSNKVSVSLELYHMHPYLAEYERELVLSKNGREKNRQSLFPDTGGYTSTNLYSCGSNIILVQGYFDEWIANLSDYSITKGNCTTQEKTYIGAFHGAGRQPWKFFSKSDREEKLLEPQGG